MVADVGEPIRRRISSIREDHHSGSTALTRRAGETLALLADHEPSSAAVFVNALETTCRLLVAAQPSMASILNLANSSLLIGDYAGESEDLRVLLKAEVSRFLEGMEESGRAVRAAAASLIQDGMTVLTHSSSETVRRALAQAHSAGRKLRVICTESRPVREGVSLAKSLGEAGIPVTLIVDAAMMTVLHEADLVLVGADAVTTDSVVNKAGTAALALAARELHKQVYVLAGSEKFLPAGYSLPVELPKDPAEVLEQPPAGVSVRNLYFDRTPLEWLTGVVSQDGVLGPAALRERLRGMPLHPALL